MKQLLFLVMILSLSIACDQKPKNPIAEYGDAMINAYKKGQEAGEIANLHAVKSAVQAFHAANGKYPKNLDEINDFIGSEIDESKYDYNPQTGKVILGSR